jgi:plastocyanin
MDRKWPALAVVVLLAMFPACAKSKTTATPSSSPPPSGSYVMVDHTTPSGHNFEFVDFFPRNSLTIHSGQTVDFRWSNNPDGFHTVTLLKNGETPQQAWGAYPLVAPDPQRPSTMIVNPKIAIPTNPSCGMAAPCTYDGMGDLNSGPSPTTGQFSFKVKITAPAGTTVNFVCLIHPGMHGSLRVVAPSEATTASSEISSAIETQASASMKAAQTAESAVTSPKATATNADGSHTYTLTAGTAAPNVEVLEMLPRSFTLKTGDSVKWVTTGITEVHTVTFPTGASQGNPFPEFCRGTGGALTPESPGASGPPCGDVTKHVIGFNPAPAGAKTISSTSTFWTSGLIATPPAPFPTTTGAEKFSAAGSFNYFCEVHFRGMIGSLTVSKS